MVEGESSREVSTHDQRASHRNIVRMPVLMRELWLEMWHDIHPDKKSNFLTKAKRGPLRDEDCYWDYGKARCAWSEYCEYRYLFGDVHLGQLQNKEFFN